MRRDSRVMRYGIHVLVCLAIFAVATCINHQINIGQSHQYTVTEDFCTLYQEITEMGQEGEWTVFKGWGFDSENHEGAVTCEVILKDMESGNSLWPKMEKTVREQEIPKKYTGGQECSARNFEGRIKTRKLNTEAVYEILLRYSCAEYVRTITTGKCLFNGELSGYNPKTFKLPNIAGTAIEEKIRGAELFHYFPEGMWVYHTQGMLHILMDKEVITDEPGLELPVFWYTENKEEIQEERQVHGRGYIPNYISKTVFEEANGLCYLEIVLPAIPITQIEVGLYLNGDGWLFHCRRQLD